ncbi:camp-dependent protein kinase catalytic subunit [Geranomyces variabilis]|nr:camp-dependent protein kinase catalytic subunit [Geranomyces variabilis]
MQTARDSLPRRDGSLPRRKPSLKDGVNLPRQEGGLPRLEALPNGSSTLPRSGAAVPPIESRPSAHNSSAHLYATAAPDHHRSTRETSRAVLESFGSVQTCPKPSSRTSAAKATASPAPFSRTLDRAAGKSAANVKEDQRGSEELDDLKRRAQRSEKRRIPGDSAHHHRHESSEDFDDHNGVRGGRTSATAAHKAPSRSGRYAGESSEGISELSNGPLPPLSKGKRPTSGGTHVAPAVNGPGAVPPPRKAFPDRDSPPTSAAAPVNPFPATSRALPHSHESDSAGATELDQVIRTQLAAPAPRGGAPSAARRIERAVSVHQRGPFKYELGDFVLQKSLGQGAFAKVYLVKRNVDGKLFALKSMRKDNVVKMQQVQHVQNERHLMENMRNPFLVGLEATFQDSQHIFMIIDYMPGGDLFGQIQRLNNLDEPLARFYATEVAMALSYLHSENIVYRDLKPENVLIDVNGHAKLGDFGFAKVIDGPTKTFCGTPSYIPPEILLHKEHSSAVDWWSFGVLLFEMLSGFSPFQEDTATRTYERILQGAIQWPPERTRFFSKPAESLIEALLVFSPFKRLGCEDESEIRDHPFFASVDWRAVKTRKQPVPVGATKGGPNSLRRSASSGNGFLNDRASEMGNATLFEISAWRSNSASAAGGGMMPTCPSEMFKDF